MSKEKVWVPIDEGNKFKCRECDFSHDDPRAVQLHHNRRHGGKVEQKRTNQKHVHQWRMLRRSDPQEAAAIERGYTRICKECEEVDE